MRSADPGSTPRAPWHGLVLLFALYFVQGMPFGFQVSVVPVYLREAGISLKAIGFASLLSLPWMTKVLWAPLVERSGWRGLGRRRSWILTMQVALALTCAAAAFVDPKTELWALLGLVFCMNLFAATMDIAVDGLAVDLLAGTQLGYGNIAQVVGYKLGMLTAGGVLLMASEHIGWQGMFASMSGLVLIGFVAALLVREPATDHVPSKVGDIVALATRALRAPEVGFLLVFIGTYKLGESMADVLFKPFLVDAAFTRGQIGELNTYGKIASPLGSLVGGLLATRIGFLRAVVITALLRVIPIAGQWWLTASEPTFQGVLVVTLGEHFFGGALTVAMFTFMMAQVDRRIGATHFTVFATVEVLGKSLSGMIAGLIADATSYSFTYGLAVALSIAFLALLVPVARVASTPHR